MANTATDPTHVPERQGGRDMVTACVGLGSNLGDRHAAMRAAVGHIDRHPHMRVDPDRGIASLYETSPVGGPPGQPTYFNSALRVRTSLAPAELLAAMLTIEAALGRTRGERWASRRIDIDLLWVDDMVCDDAGLTLPHPRLHERRFVLEPLSEIAGDWVHPRLLVTIASLTERLRAADTMNTVVRVAGPGWSRQTAAATVARGTRRLERSRWPAVRGTRLRFER